MNKKLKKTTYTLPESIGARDVFDVAWPIVVGMLAFTVTSVVDVIFVSQLGTAALAGVGLAVPIYYALHSFGAGVLRGAKILVARATGAGDDARALTLAWHGLVVAALMGSVELGLLPGTEALVGALGGRGATLEQGSAYLEMRLVGAPIGLVFFMLSCYFQGRGETRVPMMATLAVNLVNLGLTPLFIFELEMGAGGAALATSVSYVVGAVYLGLRLAPELRAAMPTLRVEPVVAIWRLGMPLGVRSTLEVGTYLVLAAVLAAVGDAHLAAHVLVMRIISVSFLPGYGLSEAVSIIVGQALGADRPELIEQARRVTNRVAVGLMACCGLTFVAVPRLWLDIFAPEPASIDVAVWLLRIAALFQVFDAVLMVTQGALNGAGDTRFVMVSSVVVAWVVKLPLAWALAVPLGMGALGVWVGFTLEIVVLMFVSQHRYRSGAWRGATETKLSTVKERAKKLASR